jgi:predicted amidohydrolase
MPRNRKRWNVAAVQMTSTADVKRNVSRSLRFVREAADGGADLVALPENFACLRKEGSRITFREGLDGELVDTFRREARELRIHLLLGSIPERIPRSPRIHNTSILIGPSGKVLAVYRKMHLFDINIRGGAVLRESRTVAPGDRPVIVSTPLGRLGLSVCYDLRFPELYRHLALDGAEVLLIPSAFTAYTGPHHWLPLLRARAIENQCWVVAPAQVGRHGAGRHSHGETAIIDPWGAVIERREDGEGIASAKIDLDALRRVRTGLPCLTHVKRELLGRRGRVRGSARF